MSSEISGISFRAWAEGDDLALLQVWDGPRTPQAHEDRTMLRASSDTPFARCIVAEDSGVPVAAAVVYSSSLHPQRYWFYAEVASGLRRRGIATELLRLLRLELPEGAALTPMVRPASLRPRASATCNAPAWWSWSPASSRHPPWKRGS
jgi:ribosomal protein S18 acetylase RimI-like enzyme